MNIVNSTVNRLWSAREVMPLLDYQSKSAFWTAVHTLGIPYIRINNRLIKFHRPALEDWLRRRAVGKHTAPIVSDTVAIKDGGVH